LVSALLLAVALFAACDERRKSNEELGLNPQEAAGRRVYDDYCDRCHEPYSTRGKKGPPLKGLYKHPYMSLSGLPANDDRVGDIIVHGRSQMPAYGQVLNEKQIQDLLAYMHTL
jgi:mono/diheme cytochrome c family protein